MRLSAELRERATAHVEQLARRRNITIVYRRNNVSWQGSAFRSKAGVRITYGAPIETPLGYFVHLHEIGHLTSRRQALGDRTDEGEVADEGAAWAWAAAHADPVIMSRMSGYEWRIVGQMFASYLHLAALR